MVLDVVRRHHHEGRKRLALVQAAIARLRRLGYKWQDIAAILNTTSNTMRKWRDNDEATPDPEMMQGVYNGLVMAYSTAGEAYKDEELGGLIAAIKQL